MRCNAVSVKIIKGWVLLKTGGEYCRISCTIPISARKQSLDNKHIRLNMQFVIFLPDILLEYEKAIDFRGLFLYPISRCYCPGKSMLGNSSVGGISSIRYSKNDPYQSGAGSWLQT